MKQIPTYSGTLRSHQLDVPHCITQCSGIRIFGRRIKSLVFTTDVAIIKNINADAIIAVYPFTPQPVITQAIISVADVPVFAGVETISEIKKVVDIPVVATIVSPKQDVAKRIAAGADILNVSGAAQTPQLVTIIRQQFPDIPIIATGGPTEENILHTIAAGANAITYTPPTPGELFSQRMRDYRNHFSG